MTNFLSKRSVIKPFLAIDMLTKANQKKSKDKSIINMDVGEPGIKTPNYLIKYIQGLIENESIGYTESIGIPLLREKIAQHYKRWYGTKIDSSNVALTAGASGAFILSLIAMFDVGDNVAIMTPYYPAYVNTLKSLGLNTIYIKGEVEHSFQPTLKELKRIQNKINGIIIASPANPTGSIIEKSEMILIAKWCIENNIRIISDEIYHGIEYEKKSDTMFSHNKNSIVINSFSKYFNMTGWRLGWIVASKEYIDVIEKLSMSLFLCPPNLSQLIALKVLDDNSILEKNVLIYKKNRDLLVKEFANVGLTNFSPADGAFYLYLDVSKITNDSKSLALELLDKVGVSCTPGYDFDYDNGKKYIRLSYGGDFNNIKEAAKRITNWVRQNT